MPKRTCPFPETFSSQYKIHIGPQELNNYGVFGSKYKQEIYDKTKSLLFIGAKAVMGKIWTCEEGGDEQRPGGPPQSPVGPGLLRGQMIIGQDGKLMRASPAQGVSAAPTCCRVCQKNQRSRTCCSQCDRLACSSCLRQCSSCSSLCCSVCTITDYSGQYDEVLCCSCST